jgi:acyl-CoA dehydrogenase
MPASILLNPKQLQRDYPDQRTREIMEKTVTFFEKKGKRKLKEDDHARVWYADFLDFVKEERIFYTLLTPAPYGDGETRWDTWRNCEFNEILAFYGLAYWYTWQVTILGLGPIWMSDNDELKEKAAQYLKQGEIFAFGLSEKDHGADVYSTEMALSLAEAGEFKANGEKYYIGNANQARMISTFGKLPESEEYTFFVVDSQHENFDCIQNVTNSQNYVAQFALKDYPVSEGEILSMGKDAWDTALNTVNVGKYNLGWASIGICTHALYEAITHAANRRLYDMYVTDFPHVKRMFTDAYCRLVAMKLFALRVSDYQRVASLEDRRYLLYNALVKMKVTTQGEKVIDLLWDVIAAKGFEKDMYFEMAARDIRALPKLEGTVHVNIALIVKFMRNYLFSPGRFNEVPRLDQAKNDDFLFDQGPARGLGKVKFHSYKPTFERWDLPNVNLFQKQIAAFRKMLVLAGPSKDQQKDVDFLLATGEIFSLIVYCHLILENADIYQIEPELINQIFDVMVRDFSRYALDLYGKTSTSSRQMKGCLKMIRKPIADQQEYDQIWNEHVHVLNGQYKMND